MSNSKIKKYDKKGNLVYFKDSNDGFEIWYEYDKKGNVIYTKDSSDFESWREYDKNNNAIYYKCFYKDGIEEEIWTKYDENNNRIYCKNSMTGNEYWLKYDNENNNGIKITEQEYKEIEFRKKEKEYLSRKKCSRFELIEI